MVFICVPILKLLFKKGSKSYVLRLLGILLGVLASIGMVAYFIHQSTEQTKKVSFKAARVKYREQYKLEESLSVILTEKDYRQNLSTPIRNAKSLNFTKNNNFVAETTKKNQILTNPSLTKPVVKESAAVESTQMSSDLQVLSSFDCVNSIPAVLLEYISNMFLNEYGRSHKDFHSQHRINETLPLLRQFNINCGIDQNCNSMFQYDKQYGISTNGDKTYVKKDLFYCCPSAYNEANHTISNVCKRAQKVVGKSIFRESKNSMFL